VHFLIRDLLDCGRRVLNLALGFAITAGAAAGGLLVALVVEDGPIEDEIVLIGFSEEEVLEHAAEVSVIGSVLETQRSAVVQIRDEFTWEMFAQHLDGRAHLLFHNLLVLLFFHVGLESLPRKGTAVEVHEDIS